MHIFCHIVPDHTDGQIQFPIKQLRAPPHFASAQKDLPTGKELTQIIFDFLVGGLSRCGSDDNPHPLRKTLLDERPQTSTEGFAGNLPRQGNTIAKRFKDDVTARQGHVSRDTRPFGSPTVLDNLDKKHLAFRQAILFMQCQEPIFPHIKIDKGSLDARHNIRYTASVNIANKVSLPTALNGKVAELAVKYQSHAGFFRFDTDKDGGHRAPLSSVIPSA